MEELARVAREEETRENEELERWKAFSAGTLSVPEEAELRAAAGESEETAAAWEIFRPLEAEFRARLVDRLRRQTRQSTSASGDAAELATVPLTRRFIAALRSLTGPRWMIPVAVAAALAMLLLPAGQGRPIADYHLDWSGSVQPLRSPESPADGQVSVLATGNRLELLLTPETAVEGPVAARVFVAGGAVVAPLEGARPRVSETGSVRLTGVVGREIRLPAGEWELLVVVGRPRHLPSADELVARTAGSPRIRTRQWLAWKLAVRVE